MHTRQIILTLPLVAVSNTFLILSELLLASLVWLAWVGPNFCFAEGDIKPAPAGLVSFGFPPQGWESIFNCMVCKVKWDDLEPEPGQYGPGFRKVHRLWRELARLAEEESRHGHGV